MNVDFDIHVSLNNNDLKEFGIDAKGLKDKFKRQGITPQPQNPEEAVAAFLQQKFLEGMTGQNGK